MAEIHIFLLVETALLFGASLTGFIAAITVGVTRDNFNGCPLYGDINWVNDTKPVIKSYGAATSCNFCVGVQVVAALFALVNAIYHIYVLLKKENKNMWIVPSLLVNGGFTIVIFIQACVVSVGFLQWCDAVTESTNIHSCRDGQHQNWNLIPAHGHIDGSNFYDYLKTAEITCWVSFLIFGTMVALTITRCVLARRRQPTKELSSQGTTSDRAVITQSEQSPGVI